MLKLLFIFITCLQVNTYYICTGSWSKAYHNNKECLGLAKCTKEVKEISYEEAQKTRKPCGYCFKHKKTNDTL